MGLVVFEGVQLVLLHHTSKHHAIVHMALNLIGKKLPLIIKRIITQVRPTKPQRPISVYTDTLKHMTHTHTNQAWTYTSNATTAML